MHYNTYIASTRQSREILDKRAAGPRSYPVRIAIVSTPFVPVPPPKYGGTELIVSALAEELIRRGHRVVLYATGDSRVPGAELRHLYEKAVWPPDPTRELSHASFALRDIAARGGVDVIHAHVAPAVALAPLVEQPMVYTVHHVHEP